MAVNRIAVIGAGNAGRNIAYASILGGFETMLEDVRQETLEQSLGWIRGKLDDGVERGAISAEEAVRALGRLRTASRVEEASDADLVIEAGPEEMELKIELFGMLDKFARAETILASSSRTLAIAEIAEVTQRPERCIGMRFSDRVAGARRIELVCGPATSEETIEACREVGRRMGRETVTLGQAARPRLGAAGGERNGDAETAVSIESGIMSAAEKIQFVQGDITEMAADAIVNAANNDLVLGAGVAGAIRRKGGEEIQQECNRIGTIPVGSAAITSGGRLKARWVIHAASMELGGATSPETLRGSTAHSLRLARQKGLKTIAFPAIGAGIGGFPVRECAEIMIDEAIESLRQPGTLQTIYFVLYDRPKYEIFVSVWEKKKRELAG